MHALRLRLLQRVYAGWMNLGGDNPECGGIGLRQPLRLGEWLQRRLVLIHWEFKAYKALIEKNWYTGVCKYFPCRTLHCAFDGEPRRRKKTKTDGSLSS